MSITYKGKIERGWDSTELGDTYATIVDYVFLATGGESNVTVSQRSELPIQDQVHPDSDLYTVKEIHCATEGDVTARIFNFSVTYQRSITTIQLGTDGNTVSDNTKPWKRPITNLTVGSEEQVVDFERAYATATSASKTKPVNNTVGNSLYASTTKLITVLSFQYNLHYVRPYLAGLYRDTVNRRAIYIPGYGVLDSYTGWLRMWSSSLKREYKTNGNLRWKYYSIYVEIAIADKRTDVNDGLYPWARQIANKGLQFKDANGTHRIWTAQDATTKEVSYGTRLDMQAINPNADAITEPMFLTSASAILKPPVNSTDIYFLTFHEKPSIDWKGLSFPRE